MGGATFLIFMCGFIGELVGGYLGDKWKSSGASPNLVMRSMFSGSALVAALCMLGTAYTADASQAIGLLCVAMFFIRWCGMYWSIPSILGGTSKTGVLAGTMNFCGNMAGVIVPILIGLIVQFTGSYFLVLIFFVVMAMLLAIFSSLIDYRERGLV
jgi:ACS family D-galactonate transporter-like MFS transporter